MKRSLKLSKWDEGEKIEMRETEWGFGDAQKRVRERETRRGKAEMRTTRMRMRRVEMMVTVKKSVRKRLV